MCRQKTETKRKKLAANIPSSISIVSLCALEGSVVADYGCNIAIGCQGKPLLLNEAFITKSILFQFVVPCSLYTSGSVLEYLDVHYHLLVCV